MPPALVNAFSNYLVQPTPEQRANAATLGMQGALGGASNIPGFDVVAALGPVFARNLQSALAMNNEQGARFSTGNQTQGRLLSENALQDFNLTAQQALEQGAVRQLQGLTSFGQLTNQSDAQLLQLVQQLAQVLFAGGLSQGIAVGPSTLGQIASLGGSAAAVVSAAKGSKSGGGG